MQTIKERAFKMLCMVMLGMTLIGGLIGLTALSAHAGADSFTVAVGGFVKDTLLPILGAVLASVIMYALAWVARKYKWESLLSYERVVEGIVVDAVRAIEEEAAVYFAKHKMKLTSNAKLNMAVELVLKKAPELSHAQAKTAVHAILVWLSGMGATGKVVDNKGINESI